MYANTCWGFLGLAVTFGLAMLSLPSDQAWLGPWLALAAAACFALSVGLFLWPLIKKALGLRTSKHKALTNSELREQAQQLAREMRVYAAGTHMEIAKYYQSIAGPDGMMPNGIDHEGNQLISRLAQRFEIDLRPQGIALRDEMLKRLGRSTAPNREFHTFALDQNVSHPVMIHRAADLLLWVLEGV